MEKIKKLKSFFKKEKIDGYLIPKNDEFFGEYIPDYNDRLNYISDFSGSFLLISLMILSLESVFWDEIFLLKEALFAAIEF